jgi:hypothetical protein
MKGKKQTAESKVTEGIPARSIQPKKTSGLTEAKSRSSEKR